MMDDTVPLRVLVCGSRTWADPEPIRTVLTGIVARATALGWTPTLIHGGALGADAIAADLAYELSDYYVVAEPAKWNIHGMAAGPIRNQKMLDEHKPDVVYAFRVVGRSNGTDDMIRRACKAGVPTYVVTGVSK